MAMLQPGEVDQAAAEGNDFGGLAITDDDIPF
jgi:hypothetical protein